MSILETCGGEKCNNKAKCVDGQCVCKSRFYGDGTTCKSMYWFRDSCVSFLHFLEQNTCDTAIMKIMVTHTTLHVVLKDAEPYNMGANQFFVS